MLFQERFLLMVALVVLEELEKMRPDNFERVRDELMREFGTVFGTV